LGCPNVTLEVADESPPAAQLAAFWADNRESLLAYMEQAHIGVRGLVTDASTGRPVAATILVGNNPIPVFTDPDVGDYHRLLLPGTYALTVKASGYATRTVAGVVVAGGEAAVMNVGLTATGGGGGGGGCFLRALGL
jgi:carboxypeptidase D